MLVNFVQLLPQNSPMRIVNGDAHPSGTIYGRLGYTYRKSFAAGKSAVAGQP